MDVAGFARLHFFLKSTFAGVLDEWEMSYDMAASRDVAIYRMARKWGASSFNAYFDDGRSKQVFIVRGIGDGLPNGTFHIREVELRSRGQKLVYPKEAAANEQATTEPEAPPPPKPGAKVCGAGGFVIAEVGRLTGEQRGNAYRCTLLPTRSSGGAFTDRRVGWVIAGELIIQSGIGLGGVQQIVAEWQKPMLDAMSKMVTEAREGCWFCVNFDTDGNMTPVPVIGGGAR